MHFYSIRVSSRSVGNVPSSLEVDWKVHPIYPFYLKLKRSDELVILHREGVQESEEIRSQRANEVVAVPSPSQN